MSLLDRIKECNNAANLDEYLPFFVGSIRVGWLNGEYAAIMADGSRVDRLRDIALPFFVIHGDHDSLLPSPCGEDIVKNVQLAQWLLVDGMGHDMGPGIEAVITPAVCAFMGLGAVR